MLPYLFVFAISIFSTYLAQLCYNRNNKFLFVLFSAVAILTPALLAGFRDSGIGTDTKVYVDDIWNQFKHINSWGQFYKYYIDEDFDDIEFVYLVLNYIASLFGRDVGLIYFLSNFVVVLLIYLAAFDNRERVSMWFIMFVFLFGYYNQSLNLVRQSIALAMGVYFFKYLENKQWIKLIISLIIIKYTHNTGIFYIGFVGAYLLAVGKYKLKPLILLITLFCSVFIFLYFDFIVGFFVLSGILPQKFLYYLSGDEVDYTSLFIFHFIISMILLTIYIYNSKSDQKEELLSYAFLNLLGSILILTSLVSIWSFRVAFYFLFLSECLFLPRAFYIMKEKYKLEYLLMLVVTIFLIVTVWYKVIIVNNDNDTYPYNSEFLESF